MSGVVKAKPVDPEEFTKPAPTAAPEIDVVDSFFSNIKDQIRYDPDSMVSWMDPKHYCNQHADPRLDWYWGDTSPQSQAKCESAGFVKALINAKGDLDLKGGSKVTRNGMTLLVRDIKFKRLSEARLRERVLASSRKRQRENIEELAESLGLERNVVIEESIEKQVENFSKDL